jgi:HK97 family phage major capsid protein
MLRIPAREIYANPAITQNLLDDSSIDLGAWIVDKVANRFARMEGAAFVDGDGVAKPRGYLSYPTASTGDSARPWGTLQYVPTGAAAAFASSNPGDALIDLVYSLKANFRPNAVWQMNRKTASIVRKFKDGQGNYLWSESIVAGQPSLLLGHPVDFNEEMPDLGANEFPVAFGDFGSGYTVVDRIGLRVLRDPYTAKPYVHFYTYKRVGGDVNNFEAIKLLKCATS